MMADQKEFKEKILKGAVSLTAKQFLVVILSFVSVLVTAQILGPKNYGIATISLSLFYFLNRLLSIGIPPYIIRRQDMKKKEIAQLQTFYILLATIFCAFAWMLAPAFGWWTRQTEVTGALRWLLLALWLSMCSFPSEATLQRELRFVEYGLIDGLAQAANYLLGIALALLGFSYMSLIFGAVARFTVRAILSQVYSPVLPVWKMDWAVIKPALNFGVKYSASSWMLGLKELRISLVVARFLSAEAAGIVGISIRLVQQLSILKMILQQMSISIMAKLKDAPEKAKRAISKGMAYQALFNCSLCALFSVASAWIIPIMFDERWLSSAAIFPFIASGILMLVTFNFHSSALYAKGYVREVFIFNFVYVSSLWLFSAILTPTMGIWGYGIAEILALPAFYILHRGIAKIYGAPDYKTVFWIFLATFPSLYGGIFLPPEMGILLFLVSLTSLFIVNKNVRLLVLDLIASSSLKLKS